MKKEDLHKIYNNDYATVYNDRFLLNPFSKLSTDFEMSVLKKLINKDSCWLDIGCGTGYFLSQFPGIQRAGFDLSPAMLEQARKESPDALFFKEGDFRNEMEEWNAAWSLVTTMWTPYGYVESMKEVEKVVSNMINWTKPGGSIFIPVMDIEDFRPNTIIPYEERAEEFGGALLLTGYTWTWIENGSNNFHENMVAPHAEHFVRLLAPWFEKVEVLRYPPYMPGWVSRKAILATGRRALADNRNAEIIRHPIPPPLNGAANQQFTSITSSLSNRQVISEFAARMRSGRFLKAFINRIFR